MQTVTQMPICSFRSRRVKTSALTLRIIADARYWSDSSVCFQRSDFMSYNLINFQWLFALRKPYHPHPTNPFRRGDLRIWKITISAAILPFITSTMKVLGLPVIKALFRILYAESKLTGKLIVFPGHPIEYVRRMSFTRNLKKQLIK
jgi:hypothetical protein